MPHLKVSLEAIFFDLLARELHNECSVFIFVKIICFEHLQQGSYENSTLGIFPRQCTAKRIAGCNHDGSLEDNYCVLF